MAKSLDGNPKPPIVEKKLRSLNQQLTAAHQQVRATNQQLKAANLELKAAKQKLEKSKLRYKTVFEGMINAICVYQPVNNANDFILKNLNPAAEKLEQVKKTDVSGKPILKVFPQLKKTGLPEILAKAYKSGQPIQYPHVVYQDGKVLSWRDYHVFKLPSDEVVAICNDVTESKINEDTLTSEHNLLRTLIDNMPDYIYIKDTKSCFVLNNIAHIHLMGAENQQQVIGKNDFDFFPEELASRYYADEQYLMKTGQALIDREEKTVDTKTGREMWALTTKVPLRDSEGEIVGLVGITRDITIRRNAEQQIIAANQQMEATNQQLKASQQQLTAANQQLMASEQQLRAANQQLKATQQQLENSRKLYKTMFDGTINAIVVYQPVNDGEDFIINDLNLAAETIDKIKRKNVIGKTVLEVFPSIKESKLFELLKKVYETSKPHKLPVSLYRDKNIASWREGYVYKLPSGQIVAIYGDVTARKQTEQALARSESIYRRTIENAQGVPYMLRCSDDKYDFIGSGIEQLVGIPKEKLNRKKFNSLIEEIISGPAAPEKLTINRHKVFIEDAQKYEDHKKAKSYREAIVNGQLDRYQVDIRIKTPDGKTKWLSDFSLPVKDETTGEIIGFMGILQDITNRKRIEQSLLDYQAQLKSLAAELSITEERERRRIATELHDQIGQLLVISKFKLEALRGSNQSDNIVAALNEICNSLDQVIQNTRTLTFDLSSPILREIGFEAAIAEWLSEQVQQKYGIKAYFEDDETQKPLDDDVAALLFRDVRELLINVVKHAKAKKVTVSLQRLDGNLIISVQDDGVGFESENADFIATQTGGFGLFSIRERLERIGGRIEIVSKPGKGCKVTITAPLKIDSN